MSEPKRMARVKYVPCFDTHKHDADKDGNPLWRFVYDHPERPDLHGKEVELHLLVKSRPRVEPSTGQLVLGYSDIGVKHTEPRYHWDAFIDGIPDPADIPTHGVHLTIQHPDGSQRDYPNVKLVDAALDPKPPHCCYFVPDEKK